MEKLKTYKIKDGVYIAFCDDDEPFQRSENYRYGFVVYTKEKQFYSLGSVRNWKTLTFSEDFIWDENYVYTRLLNMNIGREQINRIADNFFDIDAGQINRITGNFFDINNKCKVTSNDELQKLKIQYYFNAKCPMTKISEEEEKEIRLILEK